MNDNLNKFELPYDDDVDKQQMAQNLEHRNEKNKRIRHLLGLRNFPKRTRDEKMALLGSEDRVRALDAITTTTLPCIQKGEMKKGVVLAVAEKNLISQEVLRRHPLVNIGSGTDIEYPLAVGGRIIIMVDPILEKESIQGEVVEKIEKLISEKTTRQGNKIFFNFDFGNGKESTSVELVNKPYPIKDREIGDYDLPDDTGAIILFASQGPGGRVKTDEAMTSKLVDGGLMIEETTATIKRCDKNEIIELGSE